MDILYWADMKERESSFFEGAVKDGAREDYVKQHLVIYETKKASPFVKYE